MRKFFNTDGMLYRIFQILLEFALMDLLFLLCSIPLITMGAAWCALTESLCTFIKKGEGCFSAGHFFSVFKRCLKGSVPVWVPGAFSIGILVYETILWMSVLQGGLKIAMAGICILMILLISGILQFWLFLLAKGQKPEPPLLKDCFLLALAKFPVVIVLALIMASPALLLLVSGAVLIRIFPVLLLFVFSFIAFFCVWILSTILPQYYPGLFEEDDEG